MPVLAPLELLGVLALLYLTFRAFRWALRSKKVDKALSEVTHIPGYEVDGVINDFNYAKQRAVDTVAETDAEIERKRQKNEQLRKAYGG